MARAKKIKIPKFKTQAEKLKYIKTVMGDINKQYGNNVLNFGSNVEKLERVPFGVPEVDNLIGGGIVKGLFTTIWGQSGSGKTSLAYSLIAEAQKRDLICYYIALEPFDPKRAEMFGVDLSKLILGEFPQAEQALDSLIKFSREGLINVCILDSIQGLSPKGEQEEKSGKIRSLDKDTRALVARKLSQFFRIATDPVRKNNVAVLLIGQTRTDISGFFPIQKLSGGNALAHYSKLLINIRKGQKADAPFDKVKEEYIDEEGFEKTKTIKKQIGFDCVLKINKTQVFGTKPELTEVHFPYYFKTGFKKIIESKTTIVDFNSKSYDPKNEFDISNYKFSTKKLKKRGKPRKGE